MHKDQWSKHSPKSSLDQICLSNILDICTISELLKTYVTYSTDSKLKWSNRLSHIEYNMKIGSSKSVNIVFVSSGIKVY